MSKFNNSINLFEKAQKIIPGGVNSPVRAYKSVKGKPPFIQKGKGSHIWDIDGNEYIDFVCSWGPLILGHCHENIIKAIQNQLQKGTSYGAPTELEVEMAELIINTFPSIDMVRMVNSGTEATMSAIRLARAYTKRNKIIKFTGCYHGHTDLLLSQAGSGIATFGIPDCPGVPESATADTISIPYNNKDAVKEVFEKFPEQIAAVIIEPIAGNMGVVLPEENFLLDLRKITEEYGTLLIFDEVITGFRVDYGGVQTLLNIQPDITCLGKIIGGGLPVGVYGGKRDIMKCIAPSGSVYQAGTLSGNPLVMSAGIATLKTLKEKDTYKILNEKTNNIVSGIMDLSYKHNIPITINHTTGMFSIFFTESYSVPIIDYESVKTSNVDLFIRFFHGMLENGIYLAPSPFESVFVSLVHTDEDIDKLFKAVDHVFGEMSS